MPLWRKKLMQIFFVMKVYCSPQRKRDWNLNILENPLLENREEQELGSDIEKDLNEVKFGLQIVFRVKLW